MAQAPARAWWEDVEHLREAAERRIAERERAQREGRDRPVLTPLRPRGDEASSANRSTGRFRRADGGSAPRSRRPEAAVVASARAATAEATARVLEPAELDLDDDLDLGRAPDVELDAAPAPADETAAVRDTRPDRREELSRLAQEQERAAERAAAGRARSRASSDSPTRRTIEIRGRTVGAPALAAVPSPREVAPGTRRRPGRTPAERFAARPDRVAQWAFLLGLFLIAVAALSGH